MSSHKVHIEFPGRILIVGFGSIGRGILSLILRHIGVAPERVTIVTADDGGRAIAAEFGIKLIRETLTRESYRRILNPLLGRGDFLLNVSVDVSSIALIKLCWEPVSSRGLAAIPTRRLRLRGAPTMRCARRLWPCGLATPAPRPRC